MKEDFKMLKVGHESEDFPPKSGKWGRIRNSKKKPLRPPGKRNHKKEEKKSLSLLWKDRSTRYRPKLPSIQTTVFNPLTPVPAVTGSAKTHPQFPVPAVTGREKACEDNCLSYPP